MVHVHPVRNGSASQDNRITPGSANATAAHSSLLASRLLFIFNNSSPSSAPPPSCSSNLLFSSSTLCCCRRIRTLKIHAWFRRISGTFVFRPAQRSSVFSINLLSGCLLPAAGSGDQNKTSLKFLDQIFL